MTCYSKFRLEGYIHTPPCLNSSPPSQESMMSTLDFAITPNHIANITTAVERACNRCKQKSIKARYFNLHYINLTDSPPVLRTKPLQKMYQCHCAMHL